jgi:uncharacterized protein with PQ loop repeat
MRGSSVLALAASLVFLVRLLPQPLRTLRTGQVAGVSVAAAANAFIADAAWLAYGLSARVVAVWLVSVPALLASGWTVILLRRSAGGRDLALSATWLVAVAVAAAGGVLSLALSMAVVVCCGPAVWTAYRSAAPDGLSRWTWWLAVADASLWGSYGLVIGDGALRMYGIVMLVTVAAVLVRLRSRSAPVPLAATAGPATG